VLGVCGGIAAYKAAELASTLVQAGAIVDVVMTEGGRQFVQPLTFEGLTHRRVWTGVFEGWEDGNTGHVSLAAEADLLLIAPATANTIARLAHGFVDDMLSAIALATRAPIVIAPAMEHHMWNHPATVSNVETIRNRGVVVVGPDSGRLASGAIGVGRLSATRDIVTAARGALGQGGPLAGKSVVVTAGGTREAIDPVRYIGNRSSGRMGIALADAALDAGARVQVIATSSVDPLTLTGDVKVVESTLDMQQAVRDLLPSTDILIMAAAVADFRPQTAEARKIKKLPGQEALDLHLVKNPDILAGVQKEGLLKIGFAAETEQVVANAQQKLESKGLDLIVANEAVATIGSDQSAATLIARDREPIALPEAPKSIVASLIIAEIVRLLLARDSHA
jgi:phosphopantothenoylcysteine decarboxylase/phosphopantothenate--cysteine ligase